jgi:threonine/homoserine/homoserine lactone efflux protein
VVAVDPLLLAYLTFTTILVVTPGSTTAVVVRNTLMGGRAAGLAAAAGAAVGNTSHATAAGLGLAVVFARWPSALTLIRLGGALYLGWLGAMSVYRGVTEADGGLRLSDPTGTNGTVRDVHAGSFRQGLLVNLMNPTIITFYLVVVPTFLPSGATTSYFVGLAAYHVGLALVCHSVWALGLDRLRPVFHAPRPRRVLEGATGVALLGLAARVLMQ